MNNIWKGISITVILIFAFIYYVYTTIFPLATQIELPTNEEVLSINFLYNQMKYEVSDKQLISEFMNNFSKVKPTREQSIHDTPTIKDFMVVTFKTEPDKFIGLYLYKKRSIWYVEQPYVGIYKILNVDLIEFLDKVGDRV